VELEKAKELSMRHIIFDLSRRYNSGDRTAVLSSGANGYGRYDRNQSAELYLAARSLNMSLGKIGCRGATEIVKNAGKSDLRDVITDKSVANVFLLGHGDYHSWVATDGAVDWYDAGRMVEGHLKKGVFANLGCGAMHSWEYIPLGRFVIGSEGVLLGKSKELTSLSEMADIRNFQVLKS
jgi:hypothetical protein